MQQPVSGGIVASRRSYEAAIKRHIRNEERALRDLERRAKEQAKLSQLEQARLEVETYESRVRLLLSIHKDHGEILDWSALANALPMIAPLKHPFHEHRASQQVLLFPPDKKTDSTDFIEKARQKDEIDHLNSLQAYEQDIESWRKWKHLARRVLDGERAAYMEAVTALNPFADIGDLGSRLSFKVHDASLLICGLKVKGVDAIPEQVKALTAAGKVAVKQMPKARFHELYQDYICSCILRVARESFALLPIQTLLITATADAIDTQTGHIVERPVLSVAMPKSVVSQLDFERLDPSDSMANFVHRGDFKASRKSGAFGAIIPLTPADLEHERVSGSSTTELAARMKQIRTEIKLESDKLELKRRQQYDEE